MNRFGLLILSLLLLSMCSVYAQEIVVNSFETLDRDLTARTQERLDLNDEPCAIVKVTGPNVKEMKFEGNIIGDVTYDSGEAIIYLANLSQSLTIKSQTYGVIDYLFPKSVRKHVVYRLRLTTVTKNQVNANYGKKSDYYYKGVLFRYKIGKNGVTITGFDVDAETVVIPAQIQYNGNSYPVKEVDTFINGNNYLANNLVLEEGIERIDKYAFIEFRQLTNVKLPSTITYIGKNAFRKKDNLKFYLPSNISEAQIWNWSSSAHSNLFTDQNPDTNVETIFPPSEEAEENVKLQQPQARQRTKLCAVDTDIPATRVSNNHTYAVVIANENYLETARVDCALNDGNVFSQYCRRTLGIPENQIRVFKDAGYTDILRAIRFVEKIQMFDSQAKVIFYYAGHGISDEMSKSAYLLPVDGTPHELETCISLSTLYERLGKIKVSSVLVLLDACFWGTNRGSDNMLLTTRGIIRVKKTIPSGNLVVLTAASADETAFALKEANHGLFTYCLLKQLQETRGHITLGKLFESIKTDVTKSSVLENDKLQTPSVIYSSLMENKWKDLFIN